MPEDEGTGAAGAPELDADDDAADAAGDALDEALTAELEDEEDADDTTATTIESLGLPMPVLPVDEALALLAGGELEIVGRLWVSSNNALLGVVRADGIEAAVIHKPVVGERPLSDFPDGTLARREVAAFAASQASGWGIVPPTVLRDGPVGEGMLQLWIRTDPDADPVELVTSSDPRLRRIAAFDAAVNNTDRKAGHLLPVPGGHIYGVDHGVTFSPVPKLRTVLWAWRSEPFEADELEVLRMLRAGLDGPLGLTLRELLDRIEVAATARRLDRLLAEGVFPEPDPRWPALPWPPV
jgi:uncharacterized repeat protein (TIGR03843 family)